jgi:hypothetical protein
MKFLQLKWLFVAMIISTSLFAVLAFSSHHNNNFEPILMSREDMEAAVQVRNSREIEKPGKIWVYGNFIFVIEQCKGIHVLDNTDSENPKNLKFIQIDGCTDVAVNNGIIYANNAVDLVGLKPTLDYNSINLVSRNRNFLPQKQTPNGWINKYF